MPMPVMESGRLARLERGNMVAVYPVGTSALTIGSARESSVTVAESRVNPMHARVRPRPRGFAIEDMNSITGTWVNERKVRTVALAPGDVIRIGRTVFMFLSDKMPLKCEAQDSVGQLGLFAPGMEYVRVPISGFPVLIGRAPETNIRIRKLGLAEFHAQIVAVNDAVQVTDLSQPAPACRVIASHTSASLGPIRLEYALNESSDAATGQGAAGDSSVAGMSDREVGMSALLAAEESVADGNAETLPVEGRATEPRTGSGTAHRLGGCILTAVAGPLQGRSFLVAAKPISIGSGTGCQIHLTEAGIEPVHAKITREEGDTEIEDPVGSQVGVLVDGKRVRKYPLRPGNRVRIGSSEFLVHL